MNHINEIIVIGTNHHNTLSMVRCFGEEGRKVSLYIYGASHSYIANSIYVANVLYFATASEAIAAIPLDSSNKPLVIACSDEVSSLMDSQYDVFTQRCHFFNAGKERKITAFMDKQKQLQMAKECGFYVPSSIDVLPNDVVSSEINYPCFIKPKASIYGGKNIAICWNKEELREALKKYPPQYNILIQDYIRKDYEIVVLGISVGDKTVIPGFIQKHREEKGGTTYSTVKPISELNDGIVEACKQLINKIEYQGLWGIECIKQQDKYYFLELNMRNDATTYAMKVAGVNLPFLYLKLIENSNYHIVHNSVKIINSMVEFNDFNFVLKGKVGLFRWIREYRESECKYFFSDNDPNPFNLMRKEYLRFLRKQILTFLCLKSSSKV